MWKKLDGIKILDVNVIFGFNEIFIFFFLWIIVWYVYVKLLVFV